MISKKHLLLASLIGLLFPLLLLSCKKDEHPIHQVNTGLTGIWVDPQYTDTLVAFARASSLAQNEYAMCFNADNTCIERKNNGWCGTPPITTADYSGNWTGNDSIVHISVGYWGGTVEYIWKVVSLDYNNLVISVRSTVYHESK
ncbi:MAG: hypothetical protein ACOYN4_05090 [Bacteroidales bacterium]